MIIDRATRQQLIDMLTPHVSTVRERRAILGAAFLGTSLLDTITLEGTPRDFASNLIIASLNYGELDGDPAIIPVLDEMKARVGHDKQRQIDALIDQLRGNTPPGTNPVAQQGTPSQRTSSKVNVQTAHSPLKGTQPQTQQVESQHQQQPPSTATPARQAVVPRLRWWNPLHPLLLSWWLFYQPGKIVVHDNAYGQEAKHGAGNWLATTLTWMPVFIPSMALALRPELAAAWRAQTAFELYGIAFPLVVIIHVFVLTGAASILPKKDRGGILARLMWLGVVVVVVGGAVLSAASDAAFSVTDVAALSVAGVTTFVVAVGVAFSVADDAVAVMAVGVAFVAAVGVAFLVAGAATFVVADIVAGIVVFDVLAAVAIGVVGVAAGVAVSGVVFVVTRLVESKMADAIRRGTSSVWTQLVPPVLLICYIVIAWVSFTAPV